METHEEVQIPAHESRHDFTLTGVERPDKVFVLFKIEARVDNGTLRGKRITHTFSFTDRKEANEFVQATGTPEWARKTPESFVEWIGGQIFKARFSARIEVTKQIRSEEADDWIDVEELPDTPCKYRYLYSLTMFESPRQKSELSLASNFYERRKMIEDSRTQTPA